MGWLQRMQARGALVPAWLRALAILVPAAAVAYWGLTYSGPYRWLAEWQLRHFDQYVAVLTGGVVLIGALVPFVVALQFIGWTRQTEVAADVTARQVAATKVRAEAVTAWMQARYYRLVGAVLAVGFVVVGAYFALSGWLTGARVSIDVASLERGGEPPGRYAEISGRLLLDEAVGVRSGKRDTTTVTVYVPVVSQRWRPGQPVRVYLQTYETWLDRYVEELASGRYEGMLGIGSLPGVAQTALTEAGMAPPDRYWLLDFRWKPDAQTTMGLSLLTGGGLLGAVTALAWAAIERRNRRRAAAT